MSLNVNKDIEKAIIDAERIKQAREIQHNVYPKPPLGCTPYWFNAVSRIQDIGAAINRFDSVSSDSLDKLSLWIKELEAQVDLIKNLKKVEEHDTSRRINV